MTTRTAPNTSGIEEAAFKPVEGGYLFETPNPWIFAPGRRYVVSEEQKTALLGMMRPRRPRLRVALISTAIIAFAGGVSILWWALSPRYNPSAFDLLGIAVTTLVPLYAFAVVAIHRHLRRIQPVVSAAAPTQARFTAVERYHAIGDRMSTKLLVAGTALWSVSAITSLISLVIRSSARPIISDPLSYMTMFGAVTSSALALFAAYTLHRRLRQTG